MSTQTVSSYAFRQLEPSSPAHRAPADVIAHAHAQAQAIREQARLDGAAAGYAEGVARAQAEAAPLFTALAEAATRVAGTREELAETLTAQAGELALLTAEQIIAGAVAVEPERIVDVVRGALRRLTDRHRVTVLVNPDDLDLLAPNAGALQAQLGGIEHLDVQADRRIARGGAVAQTAYGEIDVTIAAQLRTARDLVAAALAGDAPRDRAAEGPSVTVPADGV